MNIVIADLNKPILLGEAGENLATQVQFPVADMIETYGEGTFHLTAQRPTESTVYPCAISFDSENVYWDVNSSDTSIEGVGYAQLSLYVNDTLAKTRVYITRILHSIGETEVTEPQQAWIDEVYETVDQKIADGEASLNEIISEASTTLDGKVTQAQQAVTDAQAQVTLAKAEVTKASQQVALAENQVTLAKQQADRAEQMAEQIAATALNITDPNDDGHLVVTTQEQ